MRVISQTFMDFPYEHIVVFVDDNKVCCRPVNDMSGRYYLLGEYETNERAQYLILFTKSTKRFH